MYKGGTTAYNNLTSHKNKNIALYQQTDSSDGRPASKCGAAIGDSSTLTTILPSFGLVSFGTVTSQET
jgi:hypothetical protein